MLTTPLDRLISSIARLDIYYALKEQPRMQHRFWRATSSEDAHFVVIQPKKGKKAGQTLASDGNPPKSD